MNVSINRLSELTGFDRRTIKKRVEHLPRQSDGYDSKSALECLYMSSGAQEDQLDPQQEQAKLNQARTEKVEIETQVLKGELCKTEEVRVLWASIITNAKAKLLALPHKATHQVMTLDDYADVEKLLKEIINEALDELSRDGVPGVPCVEA